MYFSRTHSSFENEHKLAGIIVGIGHPPVDMLVVEPVVASGCDFIGAARDVVGAGKESWELIIVALVAKFQCCRPGFAIGQCVVATGKPPYLFPDSPLLNKLVSACGNQWSKVGTYTSNGVDLPADSYIFEIILTQRAP